MIFRFSLTCFLVAISLTSARATFGKEHVHIKIHLATPEHHVNQIVSHYDQHGSGGPGGGDEHIEITGPAGDGLGGNDFSGDFGHGGARTPGGYGNEDTSGGSHGSSGYGGGNGLIGSHGRIGYGNAGNHAGNSLGDGHSHGLSGSLSSSNDGSGHEFGNAGLSGRYAELGGAYGKDGHLVTTLDGGHRGGYSGGSSGYSIGGGHQSGHHGGGFSPSSFDGSGNRGDPIGGGIYHFGGSMFASHHNDHSIATYGDQLSSGFSAG